MQVKYLEEFIRRFDMDEKGYLTPDETLKFFDELFDLKITESRRHFDIFKRLLKEMQIREKDRIGTDEIFEFFIYKDGYQRLKTLQLHRKTAHNLMLKQMNGFSRQYLNRSSTSTEANNLKSPSDRGLLLGCIAQPVKKDDDVAAWRLKWARYLCDAYYNGALDVGNLIFTLILLNMDIFDNYNNLSY